MTNIRFDTTTDSSKSHSPAGESLIEDFCRSAAYTAIQAPAEGLSQIANNIAGTKLSPHLIDAPTAREANTAGWYAQQFGNAAGMLPLFLATHKAVGAGLGKFATAGADSVSIMGASMSRSTFAVGEAALTGLSYEGLFRPLNGDQSDFWTARAKNALVGAVTFGAMAKTSIKLQELGLVAPAATDESASFVRSQLLPRLSSSGTGLIAGVVGGVANSETSSLLNKGRLADAQDVYRNAFDFGVMGFGLGALSKPAEQNRANQTSQRATFVSDVPSRQFVNAQEITLATDNAPKNGTVTKLWEFKHEDAARMAYDWPSGKDDLVRSPLKEMDQIDHHAQKVLQVKAGWTEDLSGLAKEVEAKRATMQTVADRASDQIMGAESIGYGQFSDSTAMRQLLAHDPVRLQLYEDYVTARDDYAQNFKALHEAIKTRVKTMAETMDELSARNGLPHVDFKSNNWLEGRAGTYTRGQGLINVKEDAFLSNADPHQLAEYSYHEFTHFDQDVTVIRGMADELQVGEKASQAQKTEIKSAYKLRFGNDLDDAFLTRVLEVRDGVPLSDYQAARLPVLTEAFKSSSSYSKFRIESGNDFRVTASELHKLNRINSGYILLDRIANDRSGTLSSRLFGSKEPPASVQQHLETLRRFEDPELQGDWPEKAIKQDLARILQQRLLDINQARQARFRAYMTADEQEAWLLGSWAASRTQGRQANSY